MSCGKARTNLPAKSYISACKIHDKHHLMVREERFCTHAHSATYNDRNEMDLLKLGLVLVRKEEIFLYPSGRSEN